ncbi:hypothetical protein F3J23_14120 [Chryseobacterium sp. Tr-659]|uniref:hypothetical protein n=1 Tax=Chryseobacterium sp. Tr-659 TaxID=2608340 RepID=UPI00141E3EDE|nr:hypothetical protein [Chryseobacterium sp. Tr-659]NIF06581.1 hypothetical protein [Chryseobacterium sp. Tr-659]
MKDFTLILLVIFCLFSCKQKQEKNNIFSLEYIKNNNELILLFDNKTSQDIIFPAPNTLEFGDENFKNFSTQGGMEGSFPITVYGVINPNQSSKFYQKKLDSIMNADLSQRDMAALINEMKPGDGNSVFYLKKMQKIKIKYNLIIRQSPPIHNYSSKFKQNYYPYNKILKGKYPEGEYLRRFSRLNFEHIKFVEQPIIKDSLILKISDKDIHH